MLASRQARRSPRRMFADSLVCQARGPQSKWERVASTVIATVRPIPSLFSAHTLHQAVGISYLPFLSTLLARGGGRTRRLRAERRMLCRHGPGFGAGALRLLAFPPAPAVALAHQAGLAHQSHLEESSFRDAPTRHLSHLRVIVAYPPHLSRFLLVHNT